MNKLILLAPFLLLMLMGIAGATTPSAIPSGIQYYVPINITNSQTTATSAPFQQMMTVNALNYTSYITFNGVSANFEYFYANGTIIPSWIESNVSNSITTWAKTIAIPASSHIQIYLGFASKTTNLLSSSGTSGIGEAPQLSSTYAQYDDGASVFTNYWNFAGTSLPTGLSTTGVGDTVTVSNGITISIPDTSGDYGWVYSTSALTAPYIIDEYTTSATNYYRYGSTNSLSIGDQNMFYGSYTEEVDQPAVSDGISGVWTGSTTTIGGVTASPSLSTLSSAVYSFSWVATGSQYYAVDYSPATSTDTNVAFSSPLYAFIGVTYPAEGNAAASLTVQWLRTRAYPPSGVMPSVTFGAVQAQVSLSISPNPATYGQAVTLTATCVPSTDTCAIDYPSLGTAIATGTGSATYTWNTTKEGIGTFSSFYANDITQGTNSTPPDPYYLCPYKYLLR